MSSAASTAVELITGRFVRGGRLLRASSWTKAHIAGLICLMVIVACSLLLVVIAADRPSIVSATTRANYFPGWMAGPLGGLWPALTRSTTMLKIVFTVSVLAMYACYALASRQIAALGAKWVMGAILAVHLIFFLSPPLTLTDVFNYIDYARMEVIHNLNPYASIPAVEPHNDPAFALSNWHNLLSPYGPLFTIVTFAIASLNVAAAFWIVKSALGLLSLAIVGLVWRCARLLGRDPVQAIIFAGLNPIVLLWGLGGDHNDFFLMFFVMLACWLLLRSAPAAATPTVPTAPSSPVSTGPPPTVSAVAPETSKRSMSPPMAWRSPLLALASNELLAGAALAAAVFVKASGAIVVPIFIAALWRTPRRAVALTIGGLLAGTLLAALSYLAFGAHIPSVMTQGSLVIGLSLPNLLGLALGLGGETELLREALALGLIAAVAACCALALRRRAFITPAGWATMALLVTLAWVLPWYIFWVLPLAALSSSRRLRGAVLAFGLYLIIAWVPTASDLTQAIGLRPEKTSLAQQHQRVVRELIN